MFEDCGINTNNMYDYVNIASGAQAFDYSGNHFSQLSSNKAKYGFNLASSSTTGFYSIVRNDFSNDLIGTSFLNNLATGPSQFICMNKPVSQFIYPLNGSIELLGSTS